MLWSTRFLRLAGAALSLLSSIPSTVSAEPFVPLPTDITTVLSKNYPGAAITYKENSICETTSGVRSWSGYVHLPSSLVSDASYNTSLFFWYFGELCECEAYPNLQCLTAPRIETRLNSCTYDALYAWWAWYFVLGRRQLLSMHCQPGFKQHDPQPLVLQRRRKHALHRHTGADRLFVHEPAKRYRGSLLWSVYSAHSR
jgi:hypothetical protein